MFSSQLAYHAYEPQVVGEHILHVDASHGPESIIGLGAVALFEALQLHPEVEVRHLRLWDESVRQRMDYRLEHVRAKMAMLSASASATQRESFAAVEALAAEIATARGLVVSAPMWNYGAPYVVKQYFDSVAHPGLTFKETSEGPIGLLGSGRPFLILTSSGGSATKDHLTPWLLDIAAMLGFDNARIVSAASLSSRERSEVSDSFKRQAAAAAEHFVKRKMAPKGDLGELEADCGHEELLFWLEKQGLSSEALESLALIQLSGEMLLAAKPADWHDEELGLPQADINLLQHLQAVFKAHFAPE